MKKDNARSYCVPLPSRVLGTTVTIPLVVSVRPSTLLARYSIFNRVHVFRQSILSTAGAVQV
jgi:hypothetical protein